MSTTLVAPTQQWRDRKYCQEYAETWEISTNDIHYGWLAPGETMLGLLRGLDLSTSAVLDVGCGMGENLVALSKKGASCFGIDISEHMLRYARGRGAKISFVRQDMRRFTAFPRTFFNIILSIYSLEYLDSIKEFRDVLATLFSRLRPGGTFVFCFSHPLQHYRHAMLRNESAVSGPHWRGPLIYSFKDVVLCLNETGFTIDRIVEQQTVNPSTITYERSLIYPYHFYPGKNPCAAAFDKLSNSAPHTVIYKVRKPDSGSLIQRQMSLDFKFGLVRIWGQNRHVSDCLVFKDGNRQFSILKLRPIDAVVGVCSVARITIKRSDLRSGDSFRVRVSGQKREIPRRSLLGILFWRQRQLGLILTFDQGWIAVPDHGKLLTNVFISRIDPAFGEFQNVFPAQEIGVLVFVNGEEPGNGKVGLQEFFPSVGDVIEVVYVACDKARSAAKQFRKSDQQMDLFSFHPTSVDAGNESP